MNQDLTTRTMFIEATEETTRTRPSKSKQGSKRFVEALVCFPPSQTNFPSYKFLLASSKSAKAAICPLSMVHGSRFFRLSTALYGLVLECFGKKGAICAFTRRYIATPTVANHNSYSYQYSTRKDSQYK